MAPDTSPQPRGPVMMPVPWAVRDLGLAVAAFLLFLGAVIVTVDLANPGDGSAADSQFLGLRLNIALAIIQGSVLAGVALYLAVVRHGAGLRDLGLTWTSRLPDYGYAIVLWFAALAAVIFYGVVVDALGIDFLLPPETARDVLDETGGLAGALVLASIWAPFTEEIFFRGFALPALGRSFTVWPAVLLGGVVFALFHIEPGAYFPTFALGVALSLSYLRSGSLLPAMLIHALHNATAILIAQSAAP